MFSTSVYINNFDLSTLQGVKIVNYNVTDMPSRVLNSSKLARANKSLLTSAEYSSKTITISGFVGGQGLDELQMNFDRLKGRVQDVEAIIRVKQGDTDVEYIGTLNGLSKEFNGPTIGFTLSFLCSNPIGRDSVGRELFSSTNITTATLTKSFTVDGSFEALPRFHLVFTSITSGTNKQVSLLNAATGKGIRITRTFVSGDVIDINSDTMEVLINGVSQDFEGQFPKFMPGARALQYIDDLGARNVTLTAVYTRQYS